MKYGFCSTAIDGETGACVVLHELKPSDFTLPVYIVFTREPGKSGTMRELNYREFCDYLDTHGILGLSSELLAQGLLMSMLRRAQRAGDPIW